MRAALEAPEPFMWAVMSAQGKALSMHFHYEEAVTALTGDIAGMLGWYVRALYLAPPDMVPRKVAERMADALVSADNGSPGWRLAVPRALAAYRAATKGAE